MNRSTKSGKIRTVAIIGAGLSGITSTAHLLRTGIDATVFERANVADGTWEFCPQVHINRDPPFPSTRPPVPGWDEPTADDLSSEKALLSFSPPGLVDVNTQSRERPSIASEDTDERVIITSDGRTTHNLQEDIFYIPDPTLASIGITHFASTFSMYDFQTHVLAAVFTTRIAPPPPYLKAAMQAEQRRRKSPVLPGALLNSIFLLDDFVIHRMLRWVNEGLVTRVFKPLQGPGCAWWEAFEMKREDAQPLLRVLQDNFFKHLWYGLG